MYASIDWLEKKILDIAKTFSVENIYWRAEPKWHKYNPLDCFKNYLPYSSLGIVIMT